MKKLGAFFRGLDGLFLLLALGYSVWLGLASTSYLYGMQPLVYTFLFLFVTAVIGVCILRGLFHIPLFLVMIGCVFVNHKLYDYAVVEATVTREPLIIFFQNDPIASAFINKYAKEHPSYGVADDFVHNYPLPLAGTTEGNESRLLFIDRCKAMMRDNCGWSDEQLNLMVWDDMLKWFRKHPNYIPFGSDRPSLESWYPQAVRYLGERQATEIANKYPWIKRAIKDSAASNYVNN